MSSQDTLQKALSILNSDTFKTMETAINELNEHNQKFQNGVKSAGTKARKKTSEWSKALSTRLKEYREVKQLLSQYRKESVSETKS